MTQPGEGQGYEQEQLIGRRSDMSINETKAARDKALIQFGDNRLLGSMNDDFQRLKKYCSDADSSFDAKYAAKKARLQALKEAARTGKPLVDVKDEISFLSDAGLLKWYKEAVMKVDAFTQVFHRSEFNDVVDLIKKVEHFRERELKSLDNAIAETEEETRRRNYDMNRHQEIMKNLKN